MKREMVTKTKWFREELWRAFWMAIAIRDTNKSTEKTLLDMFNEYFALQYPDFSTREEREKQNEIPY